MEHIEESNRLLLRNMLPSHVLNHFLSLELDSKVCIWDSAKNREVI